MAPSRRQNNGRSPLVKPQRQITSFFSKSTSPSPSPSPNLSKPKPKSKPNPSPKSSPNSSPSPSPTTPSPLQSKLKKPLLVIGQTPSPPSTPNTSATAAKSYGEEVANKRIRVYWPLDKSWYEGVVKGLDKESKKHLVQYDDAEEELLDLAKEKIEWVEESVKRFKRLRRGSLVLKRDVIEDENMENVEDKSNNHDDGDDSSDEDWGSKNVEKEVSEDNEEDNEEEEEEEEEESVKVSKQKQAVRKRKANGGGNLGSGKKTKSDGAVGKGGVKVSVLQPLNSTESK